MGRERLGPLTAFAEIIDVIHQAFGELGIVEEEERGGRIGHVDGTDRSVAVVLLREPKQVTVGSFHKLVGVDSLAVSQGTEFSIFLTTGLEGIVHHLDVEGGALLHECRILSESGQEGILDGLFAVAVPIGAEVLMEVLDREYVVVADHDLSGSLGSSSEVADYRHAAGSVIAGSADGGDLCSAGESLAEVGARTYSYIGSFLFGDEIEVTPVDAAVVTLLAEDILREGSGLEVEKTSVLEALGRGLLVGIVGSPERGCFEIDLHVVLLAVVGLDDISNIIDRAAHEVEVVKQERSHESQFQVHRTAGEAIDRAGGLDVGEVLDCSLREYGFWLLTLDDPELRLEIAFGLGRVDREDVLLLEGFYRSLGKGGEQVHVGPLSHPRHADIIEIIFSAGVASVDHEQLLPFCRCLDGDVLRHLSAPRLI